MPFTERRKSWRTQFVVGILVRVEQARREYFRHVWFVILLNMQVEIAGRLLDTQVWELRKEAWDGKSNPVQQAFLMLYNGEAPRCNLICSRSPVNKLEFKPHCTSLEN